MSPLLQTRFVHLHCLHNLYHVLLKTSCQQEGAVAGFCQNATNDFHYTNGTFEGRCFQQQNWWPST